MFDEVEKDPSLSPDEFKRIEEPLRTELVLAQYELLRHAGHSVLIVVAGIDGAGKGSTVNLLNEWLDPRHIRTLAFGEPTPEQAARPLMWRYWHGMPAKGSTGIVFGSWYLPLHEAASRKAPDFAELQVQAEAVNRFEAMLTADGVRLVKLWFHLSKDAQEARCKRLLADPDTAWRVSEEDLKVVKNFERLRGGAEWVIRATNRAAAPWRIVPGADDRLRIVTTARQVLEALRQREAPSTPPTPAWPAPVGDRFEGLDFSASLSKDNYDDQLAHWQGRLARQVRDKNFKRRSLVLVFEGDDAAGKGGAIRRVTHALDARQFELIPVAAPNDEARARPYLWRFWERVPALGRIAIFDRSWYGRVLVERVEGFAAEADWQRAYGEIVDFEAQLVGGGAVVVKFWLAISKDEQLARFKAREKTPFKSFKITEEDWRNRERWEDYKLAASEMLARTDTAFAPWMVIASDDKRYARVAVLRAIVEALERSSSRGGAPA